MKISIISPQSHNNGNTVSSILIGLGLSELKRKILLTHVQPQSPTFEGYLGFEAYEDKTSTPSQLVKLMREGAIQPEEIGDYCKNLEDFLDVFANSNLNFIKDDMETLLKFILEADTKYEYTLFDFDVENNGFEDELALKKSDIVILNLNNSVNDIAHFNKNRKRIGKACSGKKVIAICSAYDSKSGKLKDLAKQLNLNTTIYPIRYNSWVQWACNKGKLDYVFKQGKTKDKDVIEVYRDIMTIVNVIVKTKAKINKEKMSGKRGRTKEVIGV